MGFFVNTLTVFVVFHWVDPFVSFSEIRSAGQVKSKSTFLPKSDHITSINSTMITEIKNCTECDTKDLYTFIFFIGSKVRRC